MDPKELYRLVRHQSPSIVRTLQQHGYDDDDIAQECYLAVYKAENSYDQTISKPSTWRTHVCRNHLHNILRSALASRDRTQNYCKPEGYKSSEWNDLLDGLSDREKDVVTRRYLGDEKFHEIGASLGITEGGAAWINQSALTKMRLQCQR